MDKSISLRTVVNAKTVLREGTEEEKKALESSEAKAKPLAEKIRQREKQSANGEVVDDTGVPVPKAAIGVLEPETRGPECPEPNIRGARPSEKAAAERPDVVGGQSQRRIGGFEQRDQ